MEIYVIVQYRVSEADVHQNVQNATDSGSDVQNATDSSGKL
jgi:hypothetical protein